MNPYDIKDPRKLASALVDRLRRLDHEREKINPVLLEIDKLKKENENLKKITDALADQWCTHNTKWDQAMKSHYDPFRIEELKAFLKPKPTEKKS